MKKPLKFTFKLSAVLLAITPTLLSTAVIASAQELSSSVTQSHTTYTFDELITIVDPYIKETFLSYSIINEQELLTKIGAKNLELVKKRLDQANE